MRFFTCLVAAYCISASLVYAEDTPKYSAAQQEVVNVSKARMDAAVKRDLTASARYLADDGIFSSDEGNLITRSQMMEHYRTVFAEYDRSVDPRDYVVGVYGDTAVANLRVTVHEQFGDTDIISEQRRTETWLKRNSAWQLIAMQWDNMPVNFRKPRIVETSVYQDYAGQYEMRPGADVETLFVKDGRLWSSIGSDTVEYLPLTSDTFFLKEGDLANFTFSRDASGGVTGYTYHRIDGQEIHARKIN